MKFAELTNGFDIGSPAKKLAKVVVESILLPLGKKFVEATDNPYDDIAFATVSKFLTDMVKDW